MSKTRLAQLAQQRAEDQVRRADAEWQEINRRDALGWAWENIYVCGPLPGQPVDYDRWVANLLAFASAAREACVADKFTSTTVDSADERNALSLVTAAISGGKAAVRKRLEELDGDRDDRGWKIVFTRTVLFERVLYPERFLAEETAAKDTVQTKPEKTTSATDAETRADMEKMMTPLFGKQAVQWVAQLLADEAALLDRRCLDDQQWLQLRASVAQRIHMVLEATARFRNSQSKAKVPKSKESKTADRNEAFLTEFGQCFEHIGRGAITEFAVKKRGLPPDASRAEKTRAREWMTKILQAARDERKRRKRATGKREFSRRK